MQFSLLRCARGVAALMFLSAACQSVGTEPISDPPTAPAPVTPVQDAQDLADARIAWSYVENNTLNETGLANAVDGFRNVTIWDIASLIGAAYSAHELAIVGDVAYDERIRKILSSLQQMPLFDHGAFNKFYDARTLQMVDRSFTPTRTGFGWSATDIGRLLIWLRILADNQPQYAELATAIAQRIDMSRIVKNGNLEAIDLDPVTGATRYYAETGLGYEQYAAAGYALWGSRAVDALNANANVTTRRIYGVDVPVDKRGTGRVTSEPYIMMGLETGWYSPTLARHATQVLAAQQARHDSTGLMTIVSEDHLPDAPYFFYYYSVYTYGRSFVVEGPDVASFVEQPRWVSTKAAFAWRSLVPTPYTEAAVEAVRGSAIAGKGWGAGMYEASATPTGETNLNTAGIVLEALAYRRLGKPFLPITIQ